MLKASCHELLPFRCSLYAYNNVAQSGDPEDERNVRPANVAITFFAVLQASAQFQFIYIVIMGVGLISVPLLIMERLNVNYQIRPPTGIFWPLFLWALYFGVLSRELADKATKRLVSSA